MHDHKTVSENLALPDLIAVLENSDLNRHVRRAVLTEVSRVTDRLRRVRLPVQEARFSLIRCEDCGGIELSMECREVSHFVTVA